MSTAGRCIIVKDAAHAHVHRVYYADDVGILREALLQTLVAWHIDTFTENWSRPVALAVHVASSYACGALHGS